MPFLKNLSGFAKIEPQSQIYRFARQKRKPLKGFFKRN